MKKIILAASVLLLAIAAIARLYFLDISGSSRYIEKSLGLIPADASFIFEFTNDKGFYELFSSYNLFDDVIGNEKKNELILLKNELTANKFLAPITDGQNLFLSLHPGKDSSISFLWVMPLKDELSIREYSSILRSNDSVSVKINGADKSIRIELQTLENNKTFYVNIRKGIAAGSWSKTLLQSCLNENNPKISKEFIKKITSANLKNENSPANLFINLHTLNPFLSTFYKSAANSKFVLLNNLSGLSSLSMNYKSDALVFNGLTYPDTAVSNYTNIFLHQKPIRNTIFRIVPENTSNFTAYGISDLKTFQHDLHKLLIKRKEKQKLLIALGDINKQTGIDLEEETNKLWNSELLTFQLSTQEKFGAVKLSNGQQLSFILEPLSSGYSPGIRRLNYSNIMYTFFGDPFKQFPKPYFTVKDNYLVFSNSPGSIQHFLNSYNADKVLFKTSGYQQFSQSAADQSNIFLFIHNYNSASNVSSYLKPEYGSGFKSKTFGLQKFYAFSCQLSSSSTHFFTNVFSGYKESILKKKESETESNRAAADSLK